VAYSVEEREMTQKREMKWCEYMALLDAKSPKEDKLTFRNVEKKSGQSQGSDVMSSIGYIKQMEVLSEFPSLKEHLYYTRLFNSRTWFYQVFLWIGPKDAVTGMHNDDENNFLAQVYGRKRVILFPPSARPYLYVNNKYDSGTLCCDVDPEDVETAEKYPLYKKAVKTALIAELGPGEMLFIPRNWFHHVRTLSTSISVNFFASTLIEMLTWGAKRAILWIFHQLGLYKRGNCVCHRVK